MAIDWDRLVLAPIMQVFGEDLPCRYLPANGASRFDLPSAVFDAEYRGISLAGDLADANESRPVLGVRLALFPHQPPKQGDRVLVRSVNTVFLVSDVHADGHQWAKLLLMIARDQSVW